MKRAYTIAVPVVQRAKAGQEGGGARIIPMRAAAGACTLCGSSVRLPHRNGHECILALDEEISGLVHRTHTLRKFRAQLVSQRAQLFRDILKRTSRGLVKRTLP